MILNTRDCEYACFMLSVYLIMCT